MTHTLVLTENDLTETAIGRSKAKTIAGLQTFLVHKATRLFGGAIREGVDDSVWVSDETIVGGYIRAKDGRCLRLDP